MRPSVNGDKGELLVLSRTYLIYIYIYTAFYETIALKHLVHRVTPHVCNCSTFTACSSRLLSMKNDSLCFPEAMFDFSNSLICLGIGSPVADLVEVICQRVYQRLFFGRGDYCLDRALTSTAEDRDPFPVLQVYPSSFSASRVFWGLEERRSIFVMSLTRGDHNL
jgi:hypothetical protein